MVGGCGCVEPGLQTQIQWRETHCRQGRHTGLLLQRDKGYVCKYSVSAGGWNLSNPDTNGAEKTLFQVLYTWGGKSVSCLEVSA